MTDVYSIGEMVIDFIPGERTGQLYQEGRRRPG